MQKWFEKFIAYHAPGKLHAESVKRIEEVYGVWDEHDKELNDLWHNTNPQSRQNLADAFRKELEQQWPKEFSELASKFSQNLVESLITYTEMAYAVGYMGGRLWISEEHLADFTLLLGDKLAYDIRAELKGAKSKGIAFASAFTAVAVEGHLAAKDQ